MEPNIKGYLICESTTFAEKPRIISNVNCNRVLIDTKLQDADVRNRNSRMYPKGVINNGLQTEYVRERLATKSFYGEAGHPLKPDMKRQLYMDQSNISHIVNSVNWEGNVLRGVVEAANTARGADFDGLIRQGSMVAFSLRAVGPISEKRGDITVIKDPLTIFCYDWVIHPSHRVAYMDKIISEAADMGNAICEDVGVFTPIYAGNAIDYIKQQSPNFKVISESFEAGNESVYLSEDCKTIYLQKNTDTVAVNVEDYITEEVSNHLLKF